MSKKPAEAGSAGIGRSGQGDRSDRPPGQRDEQLGARAHKAIDEECVRAALVAGEIGQDEVGGHLTLEPRREASGEDDLLDLSLADRIERVTDQPHPDLEPVVAEMAIGQDGGWC